MKPAWLTVALLATALTYAVWFILRGDGLAAAVFALPPLLLAWHSARRGRHVHFWAGMTALLWFSHGVMVAWSRAPDRVPALMVTVLSLWVVWLACLPGWHARRAKRRAG